MSDELVTIYALLDPDTAEIRYVGKSVNVKARQANRIRVARKSPKTKCDKWVAELLAVGKKPDVVTLARVPEETWESEECKWIGRCAQEGNRLLNVSVGGLGGMAGVPKSEEHKKKISAAQRGRSLTDAHRQAVKESWKDRRKLPWSEKHRAVSSDKMRERMADPDYAAKMQEFARRPKSPETRERMREAARRRWARERGEV